MAESIRVGYAPVRRATPAAADRPRLAWAGYAASGWAVLALPIHIYYGLGGTVGRSLDRELVDQLGVGAAEFAWRAGHWATAAVVAAIALLALALVRPWGRALPDWLPGVHGRRVPSWLLLMPAFAVTVMTLSYAIGDVLRDGARAAAVGSDLFDRAQLTGVERGALDFVAWIGAQQQAGYPFGLGMVGPWSFGLGVLLLVATMSYLGGATAKRIWLVVVALGVLRLLLAFDPLRALGWW
jgi:hypothetical protein